jgi:hypothetical protein
MKKVIVAAISTAAVLFTSSGASAQLCVFGLFISAAHAGLHEHRELTTEEAWSCGLLYMTKDHSAKNVSETPAPKKVTRRTKRH